MQLDKCTEMINNNNKQDEKTNSKPTQTDIVSSVLSLDVTETQELTQRANIITVDSVKKPSENNNINVLEDTIKNTLTANSQNRSVYFFCLIFTLHTKSKLKIKCWFLILQLLN